MKRVGLLLLFSLAACGSVAHHYAETAQRAVVPRAEAVTATSVAAPARTCPFCGESMVAVAADDPWVRVYRDPGCGAELRVFADGSESGSVLSGGQRRVYVAGVKAPQASGHPVERPGHAVTEPAHPVVRPGHAVNRPAHPVGRPGHAVTRPGHAVSLPGHAVSLPGHAVTRPGHALGLPGHPVSRPSHPVARAAHPVPRSGHPAARSVRPVPRASAPARASSAREYAPPRKYAPAARAPR